LTKFVARSEAWRGFVGLPLGRRVASLLAMTLRIKGSSRRR
jgi:hypothetical protein